MKQQAIQMSKVLQSVIVISNEPWGNLKFSKHHYASALSNDYLTYFVNPAKKWSIAHSVKPTEVNFNFVSNNLCIVDYTKRLPGTVDAKGDRNVLDLIIKHASTNKILIWQFDPFRFVDKPKNAKRIYHVVDPYHEVSNNEYISNDSELIVCVNNLINNHYSNWKAKSIIQPHAFNQPLKLTATRGKDVLLAGTINHSTNLTLLNDLLNSLTDARLLFIGNFECDSTSDLESIKNHTHFKHMPPKSTNFLEHVIDSAAVCIVPYLKDGIHRYRSPLKINSYVSRGKPVITTNGNFIPELRDKLVFEANSSEMFINLVKKGLNNTLQTDVTGLDATVAQNTYKSAIKKIIFELDARS